MQGKDIEINNTFEYTEFGDTRNRKGLIEDGYTKHNKGGKERVRIYYTKLKREAQSEKDKEKNKKPEPVVKDVKSKKRILKGIELDEKEYGNNAQHIVKKEKKKKIPRKDRVRF